MRLMGQSSQAPLVNVRILPMAVSGPRERSLGTVGRAMEPVWRSERPRAMLGRPKFLLASGVALECMAPTPENFAGRPVRAQSDGCVLRSAERREAEGRALLQRGILGTLCARGAGVDRHGITARPPSAPPRGLRPRDARHRHRDG